MGSSNLTIVIFMYFSKAFDSVPFPWLLLRISIYGLLNALPHLVADFLKEWTFPM